MFSEHVKSICQETNNKVKAFSSVVRDLELQKASLLYNSFILTTFNYCPLTWMFCGKPTSDMANRVHKRALRVLLSDYDSSIEELLHKNEEVTIHEKNLQKLMLEVYRYVTSGDPSFLWELFNRKTLPYTLRIKNSPPTSKHDDQKVWERVSYI